MSAPLFRRPRYTEGKCPDGRLRYNGVAFVLYKRALSVIPFLLCSPQMGGVTIDKIRYNLCHNIINVCYLIKGRQKSCDLQ